MKTGDGGYVEEDDSKQGCLSLHANVSTSLGTNVTALEDKNLFLLHCKYNFHLYGVVNLMMAFELYGMLAGNVSLMTVENVKPAYGGDEEAFFTKVVTPICNVIARVLEHYLLTLIMEQSREIKTFPMEKLWSVDCFRLGWPMRADADFFPCLRSHVNLKKIGMAKQLAMIIVAWNGDGTPARIFDPDVFKKVLRVFITASILKLGQGHVDVQFCPSRYLTLSFPCEHDFRYSYSIEWQYVRPGAVPMPGAGSCTNWGSLGSSSSTWRSVLPRLQHRDLKLENTLIDGSHVPRLKMCDFVFSPLAPEVLATQEYDGKSF
ncbi:hypothetical protein L1987_36313 [Smallanthus sonchifolius]|uniref:Uncharacterized protein n=1 Tax=Smallanthus sonchifolius TaxID=185202 RepID=A0ACB9HE31_9ASTR|nr:hypothetical protein L1987_36313 [Smallanthus sonchifolius]